MPAPVSAPAPARDFHVDADTKVGVNLTIDKWWQVVCIFFGLLIMLVGFHANAMASIDNRIERSAQRVAERQQNYVTEAAVRKLLDEQRVQFKADLDEVRRDIIDILKTRR